MRISATILFLTLSFLASPAVAAVPEPIDYQAYVTDPDGSPIDDPAVSVTLALYTVAAGGVPVWTETHVVTVDQGLFSVAMGSITPFPAGVFETPLFLGVSVAGDPEMLPRRSMNSVAFARQAGDALTVSGQSAASLDQSLHVADTANPHNVTAAQTGAASSGDLTRHEADRAAHHTRYSDGEAVGAILAADGAGSGLDADSLDGISSDAFVQPGSDFGRIGVASDLFEGAQSLGDKYVNENQFGSITSAMIADGSVGSSDINFPVSFTGADLNGGLLSLTNTSVGTDGNVPAGLLGQVSGDPGAFYTFGVLGLAPGLGATPLFGLPAGNKYGAAGVVDTGIGTAGLATGTGGVGVYGDGTAIGVQGVGINGPTKGYLGVQGSTDFDGEAALDISGLEIGVLGYSVGATATDNYGLYGSSNGTGLYAQGTVRAAELVGDVDVAGEINVNRVAYNSPRTHYYSFGDGDFISRQSETFATGVASGGTYITTTGSAALVAGLHLPDGAVVTQFQAIVDDSAAGNLSVSLVRRAHTANSFVTMANVVSSGSPGITTLTDTTIGAATVDNLLYAYHVRVFSSGWPGNATLKIKGIVVHYTVSEAG